MLQSLKSDERVYCRTCDKFLIDEEHKDSENHIVLKGIDNEMLKNPIRRILKPVELNTKNAVRIRTKICYFTGRPRF